LIVVIEDEVSKCVLVVGVGDDVRLSEVLIVVLSEV